MSKKEFVVNDQKWAEELEQGVEAYTDKLFEDMWTNDEEETSETLSGLPFCGCSQCFWREALFFIVPKLLKGYEEGKIELEK